MLPRPRIGLAETVGLARDPSPSGRRTFGALDVGRVRYVNAEGARLETVLVTGLRAGLDLEARGPFRRPPPLEIHVEASARPGRSRTSSLEPRRVEGRAALLAVMNAQHDSADRVAPRAVPHDGLFDVLVGFGDARDAASWKRRMRRGEHVPDPAITEWLADRVSVVADRPFPAVLDGRVLEMRSFEIEIERTPIGVKL